MEKVLMSIPFAVGIIAFILVYWKVMLLVGGFAGGMVFGPIAGLLAAIIAFLPANYIFEKVRFSND